MAMEKKKWMTQDENRIFLGGHTIMYPTICLCSELVQSKKRVVDILIYTYIYSLQFPKLLCHFGYVWLKCDSNCHHSFWQAATQVRQPHQALAKDKGLKAVFNREPYVLFQESQFFPQGVVNVSSTEGLSSSERPGIATQSRFPDVNIPINQPRYLLESPDSLFESGSFGSTSQLLHPQFRIVKSTCLLWLNPLLDGFLVSSSFLVKCQPLEAPVFPDSNHFTSNLFKTSNSLHPSPLHCPSHPIFRWPSLGPSASEFHLRHRLCGAQLGSAGAAKAQDARRNLEIMFFVIGTVPNGNVGIKPTTVGISLIT